MANYVDEVISEKKFISNIVIKIGANYFCTRQPDSGLVVTSPYDKMVGSLMLNPSTIDIKKVNTTIASYSFKLLDKNGIISNLVLGNGVNLIGQDVTIWLGRSRRLSTHTANDFSGYYQLPITRIKKIEHADNSYTFNTTEEIEKISRPIYAANSALLTDILAATTTIIMRDAIDAFPAAGNVRVNNEIFSYTTKNNTTKTFSGIIRGELGTTAANHTANTVCYQSETITDNPLNILLKLIISNGGTGTYDTLKDGLGILNTLVDISEIESIRDNLFLTTSIKLEFSNVDSALKFIENEILQPFNLRLTYAKNAKLSLVVLDRAVFSPVVSSITENSITSYPRWTVDDTKIVNKLKINWDYNEATGKYLSYTEFTDAASIATYDLRNPLTFSFKGIKASLDGAALIAEYARVLFARFSTPVAEVDLKTQIDQSLKNIGSKIYLESSKIPSPTGGLAFASDMEVIKRAINYQTNEASLTFAFTSFTKFRSGYIAPSDRILYIEAQNKVGILYGRAAKYRVGWFLRLWNESTSSYEVDAPNEILSFNLNENRVLLDSGFGLLLDDGTELLYDQNPSDLITFRNNWTTTLTLNHRLKFANYGEIGAEQKRYAFISNLGNNFSDSKPTYKVTY